MFGAIARAEVEHNHASGRRALLRDGEPSSSSPASAFDVVGRGRLPSTGAAAVARSTSAVAGSSTDAGSSQGIVGTHMLTGPSMGIAVGATRVAATTDIIMSGTLEKRSRYGRWQRRFFTLQRRYLTYFHDESSHHASACIDLARCSAVRVVGVRVTLSLRDGGSGRELALRTVPGAGIRMNSSADLEAVSRPAMANSAVAAQTWAQALAQQAGVEVAGMPESLRRASQRASLRPVPVMGTSASTAMHDSNTAVQNPVARQGSITSNAGAWAGAGAGIGAVAGAGEGAGAGASASAGARSRTEAKAEKSTKRVVAQSMAELRNAVDACVFDAVTATFHDLGIVHERQGNAALGEVYVRQAIDIQQQVFNASNRLDSNMGTARRTLAGIFQVQGKHREALEQLDECARISASAPREQSGESQTDSSGKYTDLHLTKLGWLESSSDCFVRGRCLRALGKEDEALSAFRDALESERGLHGQQASTPFASASLHEIGSILGSIGELEEAATALNQCLNMDTKMYGENARRGDIAATLHELGSVYNALGEHEDGVRHLNAALEMECYIFGASVAPEAKIAADAAMNDTDDGTCLGTSNTKVPRRKSLSSAALAVHPAVAATLHELGRAWLARGDSNTARRHVLHCVRIQEELLEHSSSHQDAPQVVGAGLGLADAARQHIKPGSGRNASHAALAGAFQSAAASYQLLAKIEMARGEPDSAAMAQEKSVGLAQTACHAARVKEDRTLAMRVRELAAIEKCRANLDLELDTAAKSTPKLDFPASAGNAVKRTGTMKEQSTDRGQKEEEDIAEEVVDPFALRSRASGNADFCNAAAAHSESALAHLERALGIERRLHSDQMCDANADLAQTLLETAKVLLSLRSFGRAIEMLQECLEIEQHLRGQSARAAACLHEIGVVHAARGEDGAALRYLRYAQSMDARLKLSASGDSIGRSGRISQVVAAGMLDAEMVTTQFEIARVSMRSGDHAAAVTELLQCLASARVVHGPRSDHALVAATLYGLGVAQAYRPGQRGTALRYLREALAMRERIHGKGTINPEAVAARRWVTRLEQQQQQ